MKPNACPPDLTLIQYLDRQLTPDDARRVEDHTRECQRCRQSVASLRQLADDIAAPPPSPAFDEAAHVRAVMDHLPAETVARPSVPFGRPRTRRIAVFSAIATAAAAAALVVIFARPAGVDPGTPAAPQPRGGRAPSSIERDVRVRTLALLPQPHELRTDSAVHRDTPLTAAYRNLGTKPRHLLFFAVDSGGAVHWIAPTFERPDSDPAAVALPPTPDEQVLPNGVAFDDLPPGVLRLVTVVSDGTLHVSDVERLPPADLGDAALQRRFADTVVRSVSVRVVRGVP